MSWFKKKLPCTLTYLLGTVMPCTLTIGYLILKNNALQNGWRPESKTAKQPYLGKPQPSFLGVVTHISVFLGIKTFILKVLGSKGRNHPSPVVTCV